jgi:hypothetical protein
LFFYGARGEACACGLSERWVFNYALGIRVLCSFSAKSLKICKDDT